MNTEPSIIIGGIRAMATALLAVWAAFGGSLDDTQRQAILGLIAVVAPIIASVVIRGKVFSPHSVQAQVNTAQSQGAKGGTVALVAP
ncbi:MAG: hypothetical protein ACR2OO_05190 [Thermomicrobiales bacterium]